MDTAKPKRLANQLLIRVLSLVMGDDSVDHNLTVPSDLPRGKAGLFGQSGRRRV